MRLLLATSLWIATSLAAEAHEEPGVGPYILHGLGRAFTGSSDPSAMSASMASPVPTQTGLEGVPSSTTSSLVTYANITWSSDFNQSYVSHAKSCWSEYTSWFISAYVDTTSATSVPTITSRYDSTTLQTYSTSSIIYPTTSISTYKLCDGTPRAHYSPSTTFFNTTVTEVFSDIVTTISPTIPEPQCRPNQYDCAVYYYGSNLFDMPDDSFAKARLYGACGLPLDAGFPCLVQGGPVRLLYFPVSTTGGGQCGPEGSTITPANPPQPITTLGTTLSPDSVYISFETLYAAYRPFSGAGGAAAQIGPTFANTVIGFKSEEISTNCYATWWNRTQTANIPGYGPGTQLNFADLNSPVSASAYDCQNQCMTYSVPIINGSYTTKIIHPNPCTTIFDNFNPLIAVPTRLREMVPEWNKCKFWNPRQANVIFDPPQALTEASQEVKPTPPPGYVNPEPGPSVTPPSPGPTVPATPTAEPDNLPSSVADQQPPNAESNQPGGLTVPNQPPAHTDQDSPQPPQQGSTDVAPADSTPSSDPGSASNDDDGSAPSPILQTFTAGDRTFVASAMPENTNAVVIQGDTISVGGPAATLDGQVVTIGSQGLITVDSPPASSNEASSASQTSTSASIPAATSQSATLPASSDSSALRTTLYTNILILLCMSAMLMIN